MKKVLVLCSGNSIRSQMAEGYLRFYAKGLGIFFSAGLECKGIDTYARQVMEEDNINLEAHVSKTVDAFDGVKFDYLITICKEADQHIPKQIAYDKKVHYDIPDPAKFEGPGHEKVEFYRTVREEIKRNILKFIGKKLSKRQSDQVVSA